MPTALVILRLLTAQQAQEIEEALSAYLWALGFTVFPIRRPSSAALPTLTYRRISGGYSHELDGPAETTSPVFQIDVWGESFAANAHIVEQLRAVLDGFTGRMSRTDVFNLVWDDQQEIYAFPVSGKDEGVFQTAITFRILYREH